ncbi:hypothetical protein LNKW23_08680 [Paralimibaculum aggregatum]|uniref:SnoaL-like domain-containing protein n=1 Tax=Paralimibaculum aggregatum TaxID=3036245 RepID=A0ABQ6LN03_9RHOB|nr:hypothetical protein [Limibaculum sp. NKW23]GMG81655.1 hypothetical protein LNKW23_08680 [Limibaculum sp. NKW23]
MSPAGGAGGPDGLGGAGGPGAAGAAPGWPDDPRAAAAAAIAALHDLIARWFRGEAAAADFAGLEQALDAGLECVMPAGVVAPRDALLGGLRKGHGANPDFRIEIREVRLLGAWPAAGLILAGYVEAQFGARNTVPADNLRRSTALLALRGGRLVFRHLHETALPGPA